MGIKEAVGERWARFRAYLHSIPPHVWIGLIIGAIALVLAYLAWRNRKDPLSPLSQLSPLSSTTTTTTTPPSYTPIPLPAVPDIGNLQYPGGLYYNYNQQKTVKQTVTPTPMPQSVASRALEMFRIGEHQSWIAPLVSQQQALQNFQQSEIASWTAPLVSQTQAIQNFQQSEIASWTTPLVKAPSPTTAIQNFRQSEIASWTAPLVKAPATTPTQRGTNVSY